MSDNWKEEVIRDRLAGKRDWTDEERMELCRQLDKEHEQEIQARGKKKAELEDRWTEDNWEEKMLEHPIFAPYFQKEGATDVEAPINALSEGLSQLKYHPDHSSPLEIAQNYREEGIRHFKYKKYRFAIANFTEGLKQNCPDKKLNAQLYNNRSASHYLIGNFRSAVNDCEKALEFETGYMKVIQRAAKCVSELKSWSEVISWCDRGLRMDSGNKELLTMRAAALKELKRKERDLRKKVTEERRKLAEEGKLLEIIKERGILLKGKSSSETLTLSDLEPCHPAAYGSQVHLDEKGELVWPVLFLYPEHKESDFIQEFSENDCFADHLVVMFGEEVPPAPWDNSQKYTPGHLKVFYEDQEKSKLVAVDTSSSLQQVLSDGRYQVMGGTPAFIIIAEGSKFMEEFLAMYDTKDY